MDIANEEISADEASGNDSLRNENVPASQTMPARYRRAVEGAALALAVGAVILVLSAIGQSYAQLNLSSATDTSFGDKVRYLGSALASPLIAIMTLLAIAMCAAIRLAFAEDDDTRDRTVLAATIAIVIGGVVALATIYDIINIFAGNGFTLGGSGAARFGSVSQDLGTLMLAGVTIWIGTVLAAGVKAAKTDK